MGSLDREILEIRNTDAGISEICPGLFFGTKQFQDLRILS